MPRRARAREQLRKRLDLERDESRDGLPLNIDTVVPTAWRDLPTEYYGSEIWEMLQRGTISAAILVSEADAVQKDISDR